MIEERDEKGRIVRSSGGGRPAGARNKLQADFIAALAADFEEHGAGVIRIVRAERPWEYLKIVAAILPKELLIPDNVLEDMSDAELIEAIATIRRLKAGNKQIEQPPSEATH